MYNCDIGGNMASRNMGKCYCCGKAISRTGIIRHLDGCEKRYEIKSSNKECDLYTLVIKDEYQKTILASS